MAREVIPALEVKELILKGGGSAAFTVPSLQANGTEVVTISNVAPSGVGTATIAGWLPISVGGTVYYIPCWT